MFVPIRLNRVYEEVYGKDSSYVKTGNEREKWKQLQAILAIITKDDELIQNFPSMTIYRNRLYFYFIICTGNVLSNRIKNW